MNRSTAQLKQKMGIWLRGHDQTKTDGSGDRHRSFPGGVCALGDEVFHMCQGLNSHYFHVIGDGHQPNTRDLYTHYKDSY